MQLLKVRNLKFLKSNFEINPMPVHVALIMDGNGRWAKSRGLNRKFGHKAGVENLLAILKKSFENSAHIALRFLQNPSKSQV